MENNRLTKHVFLWAYNKASTGVKNWINIHAVRRFLHASGMQHISELHLQYTKHILLDFDVILYEYYKLKWFESLIKVDTIHGQGGNKLCTYRKFKTELPVEHKCV